MKRLRLWINSYWPDWLVLGLFTLMGIIYWWPLPLHLSTGQLEWPVIDSAFAQYIIGWGARSLTHAPWHFFDAPMFYPFHHTLAWGDNMFAITLLALPLIAVFGLMTSYNLLLIASSVLSAFTLYLLAKYLWHDRRAAILAGVVWGFGFSRILEYGHIQILAMQWLPLVLLQSEKLRRHYRLRNLIWLIIFIFLTLTTSIYVAFKAAILLAIYALTMLVLRRASLKTLWRWLLGWGIAAVLAIPIYLPSLILNLRQPTVHLDQYGTTLDQYTPFPPLGQIIVRAAHIHSSNLFSFGIVTLLLTAAGIVMLFGYGKRQPLMVAAAITAGFGFLASFGPTIVYKQHVLVHSNPFFTIPFKLIPGYKVLRTPSRWYFPLSLSIALLAGYGLHRLTRRMQTAWLAALLAALLTGWIYLENLPAPLVTYSNYRPADYPVYQWLAEQPRPTAVLELPNYPILWDPSNGPIEAKRMVMSTYHWQPRVDGGIAPYQPASYLAGAQLLSKLGQDPAAMELAKEWQIKYVLWLPQDFNGQRWNGLSPKQLKDRLDHQSGLKAVQTFPGAVVYAVGS